MGKSRLSPIALALTAMLTAGGSVHAQDSAAAGALYDKGLAEMMAGRFASACPSIAESYRLDPQAGALFTLAECEAKLGRLASAVSRYDEYLQLFEGMSGQQQKLQRGRDRSAKEAKMALAPRVPTLELRLPADAPPGTTVRRNGVLLQAPALGVPLPVDPGEHVIVVQTPQGATAEQRVSVAEGQAATLAILLPKLTAEPSNSAPVAILPPRPPATSPLAPAPTPHAASSTPTAAYVIGGVGILAIGVGGYFGVRAWSKWFDAEALCHNGKCPQEALDRKDEATTAANVANVGIGLGLVATAVSAYMLLSPSETRPGSGRLRMVPVAGPQSAALTLRGVF